MNKKLNHQQVAEMYQISLRTLDYLVATNQIPFSRIGKRLVRFDADRLEQHFREREGVEFGHGKSAN